ncbi:MAG TPA: hypothetical protein VH186_34535 [Chloroflexia bacterium]|nr:hypothetical protein [Chloroflexia bacterium]
MKRRSKIGLLMVFMLVANLIVAEPISLAADSGSFTRQISSGGTASFHNSSEGVDTGVQWPEFPKGLDGNEADAGGTGNTGNPASPVINRSKSDKGRDDGGSDDGSRNNAKGKLLQSFTGLNLRQQRLANGGNQFTLEPPDQGLCVGNGFVLESVNDVLRVFDTSGNPRSGVVDLNTFYGYPAAINRSTGEQGPFITDPSCYYDNDTHRFYHVVLTLDVDPASGAFLGSNHLDIAVSKTSDPTGDWNIYRLPVQDDGSDGTPNHGCDNGPNAYGPCLGDYPHIGADAYGFYITTNEYSFFGNGYFGAQIYALSKYALAAGPASIGVTQFDTLGAVNGNPGFTVWPAISPDHDFDYRSGGTEYFLSSTAADEANGTHSARQIVLWALTNTRSLNSANPGVSISNTLLNVKLYTVPPASNQKNGPAPLRDCLNDASPNGCGTFLLGAKPPFTETLAPLDSNDSRMQQVTYAHGKLYGALDTGVKINGQTKAGIAWYIINPEAEGKRVKGEVNKQGYLAVPGNNVNYPAIAINSKGKGIMAFSLVGDDYYPSAAYATISEAGVGEVQVAGLGAGPQDGFSGYKTFGNPPRPRWGDYGAAVADGENIWIASEYIAQTCTLQQYVSAPFGSCGGTRTSLGNWATRVSQVKP